MSDNKPHQSGSAQRQTLQEVVEHYLHDGHLQTFEDRERFRNEARAALGRLQGASSAEQQPVAWLWRYKGRRGDWEYLSRHPQFASFNIERMDCEPLYAAPCPSPAAIVTQTDFMTAYINAGCTGMSVSDMASWVFSKFDVRAKP